MNKSSELDCYLYYMWNAWSHSDSIRLFGDQLGYHIWNKWLNECGNCGKGAPASFYSELDKETRRKIVEHAVNFFNK